MAELWICLIKVSQGLEYASRTKYARSRNMARLLIYKGYKWYWICPNKCKYDLPMPQYVWVCLNNAEYSWISFKMIKLRMSDMVHNIRLLYKLMSFIKTKANLEHCQIFKMEHFAKGIMPECRPTIWSFQGRRGQK